MPVYCSDTTPPPRPGNHSQIGELSRWQSPPPIDPNPLPEPVSKDSDLPKVSNGGGWV